MADYIKREDAVALLSCFTEIDPLGNTPKVIAEHLPAADVKEVMRGRWKPLSLKFGSTAFYCSVCKHVTDVPICTKEPLYNYCPICGAVMDAEVDDEQ